MQIYTFLEFWTIRSVTVKCLINIFVEAGSTLPGELLYNNLVNKIILFISPKIIGESKFVPFGSKGINKIINSYKPKKIINSSIEDDILIKAWI